VTLDVLGIGYAGVGVATTIVLAVARGLPTLTDALLGIAMWPLWLPLALVRDPKDHREHELLGALARAQASPLAGVLPDADSARVLASRLREANQRLSELDEVLARPDFDPAAVQRRVDELRAHGLIAAAATAELRIKTLGQLRTLRERYRCELAEVDELVSQLVTQAELLRLQPTAATASSELVRELVSRVEGLGDLFSYQHTLETDEEYLAAWKRSTS